MKKRLFILVVLCSSFLIPSVSFGNREIEIQISKESKDVKTVYIITKADPGYNHNYLEELVQIFKFDIENSILFKLISGRRDSKTVGIKDTLVLNKTGANIAIQLEYSERMLTVSVNGLENKLLKKIGPVILSEDLSKDRQIIHSIFDSIYSLFTGYEGIASSKILYTLREKHNSLNSDKWTSDVWLCDYDGVNNIQLTEENSLCISPIFVPKISPEGNDIAFVSFKNGQAKVYGKKLGSKKTNMIVNLGANQFTPSISLKGNRIAFISDVTGNPDIFLQRFSPEKGAFGKPIRLFEKNFGVQGCPSFNPSGSKLAFVSNKDGAPRIYIVEVFDFDKQIKRIRKAEAPKLISKKNRENTSPAWSPDGKRIAYSALTNNVRQIWIYDMMDKTEKQITFGNKHKENPSWACDSMHIIFNEILNENTSELCLTNICNKNVLQVTGNGQEKRFPFCANICLAN